MASRQREIERRLDNTTAGDFCRRFDADHINVLQDLYDDIRIGVWKHQPASFFQQAILDADGTLTATTGQCKQGMDISYNGLWCYHPLLVSLANTREVLRIVNRPGNRPSHEGAAEALDRAIATCLVAAFAASCSVATPTSPKPHTSTAGTTRAVSNSSSATTVWPTSRSWRSNCPPTPGKSCNGHPNTRP